MDTASQDASPNESLQSSEQVKRTAERYFWPGSSFRGVPITHIFHVNVNCSNLDVSKPFYESLGFQSVLDLPTGGDANLARGLDLPNCDGRATIMMLDPSQPRQTRLDLLEWVEPRDPAPPYEHLGRLGIARIALRSTDIAADYERLLAAGVNFLSPPQMMGSHTRFVCFHDPDGSIIELIEFVTSAE